MADPRLSDKELAALNAAAVTREYNVHPRLGRDRVLQSARPSPILMLIVRLDYKTVSAING